MLVPYPDYNLDENYIRPSKQGDDGGTKNERRWSEATIEVQDRNCKADRILGGGERGAMRSLPRYARDSGKRNFNDFQTRSMEDPCDLRYHYFLRDPSY